MKHEATASILSDFEHFRKTGNAVGIVAYNALMPYRQHELNWTEEQKQTLIKIAISGGYEQEMKAIGIL